MNNSMINCTHQKEGYKSTLMVPGAYTAHLNRFSIDPQINTYFWHTQSSQKYFRPTLSSLKSSWTKMKMGNNFEVILIVKPARFHHKYLNCYHASPSWYEMVENKYTKLRGFLIYVFCKHMDTILMIQTFKMSFD